jgi:hypothetical protein
VSRQKLRIQNTDLDNLISNLRDEVGEIITSWILLRNLMDGERKWSSDDISRDIQNQTLTFVISAVRSCRNPILLTNVRLVGRLLLIAASVFSGFLLLISLAAAAWDMNTSLPWGLGVLMYLIPGLSLPAFLVLKFGSVRLLSLVLWFLTVASSFVFYFGDRADRVASGLRPIADSEEQVGMFLNAFTLFLLGIAVLVQVASMCASREKQITEINS